MNGYNHGTAAAPGGAPAPPPPPRYSAPAPPAYRAAAAAPRQGPSAGTGRPSVSAETLAEVRRQVPQLLSRSAAFQTLPRGQQMQIAHDTVEVASYLAQPDGKKATELPTAQAMASLGERRGPQ